MKQFLCFTTTRYFATKRLIKRQDHNFLSYKSWEMQTPGVFFLGQIKSYLKRGANSTDSKVCPQNICQEVNFLIFIARKLLCKKRIKKETEKCDIIMLKLASGNNKESLKFCTLILLILSASTFFNTSTAIDFCERSLDITEDSILVESVKLLASTSRISAVPPRVSGPSLSGSLSLSL